MRTGKAEFNRGEHAVRAARGHSRNGRKEREDTSMLIAGRRGGISQAASLAAARPSHAAACERSQVPNTRPATPKPASPWSLLRDSGLSGKPELPISYNARRLSGPRTFTFVLQIILSDFNPILSQREQKLIANSHSSLGVTSPKLLQNVLGCLGRE